MYKLLLCSEEDTASVNIRDSLTSFRKWESDGKFLYYENMAIASIPKTHIYAENVDNIAKDAGMKANEMIFLSRHKAVSGIPTLTVHPIGNFNDAEFGGRPRTLVKASPATMTSLLRSLSSADTGIFKVSFEVTHHGPCVDIPATFIEIGSDRPQWNDKSAAAIIANALLDHEEKDYITVIGIGGGHYAPRFTEIALNRKMNFGHMIPEYAFKDLDENELVRMITDSAEKSGTGLAYIHKKSMKADMVKRVVNAIELCGIEAISSNDTDVIEN
ncbi:MAG: D-aminoacyl-tRNA deacylase [Methanomassiliicoccaceae archaeon]|nr:D-aminoacyl-tRNA deacylase [Methanomassiliicoccaceae archaeon]